MKKNRILFYAVSLAVIFSACGTSETASADRFTEEYPKKSVQFLAPAGAGSGYDLTARLVAQCLQDTKLVSVPLSVTNKPGGGGEVALTYLEENRGADDVISVYSPPLCLINLNGGTPLNYRDDTTPIAKLITDYGCFAVAKDSRFKTIVQVIEELKRNPASIRIGGTSSVGSMDHIQFLKIAQAAGVEQLEDIQYTGFEDGTAAAQLLGGHVDLISTGISDVVGLVESGELRVLAITAEKRVGTGIVSEMPTCMEQGIPASFYNWRGVFGPPDLPDYALQYWETTFQKMVQTPEWQDICEKYGWDMDYQGHEEFGSFLESANEEYAALLAQIGLLRMDQGGDNLEL